jgi:hypothetical protein
MANFIYSKTHNDYTEDMSDLGSGYIGRHVYYCDRKNCWVIDGRGNYKTSKDALDQCRNDDFQHELNQHDY